MASCPNCGRQTLRTKDWACQWCGYPLISRAFKKIDKTFQELQEERNLAQGAAASEDESELEYEPEAASEPEPEPKPPPRPVFRHRTPPEPAPPVQQPPPVQPVQPAQPPPVIHLPLPQTEIAAAPAPAAYTPPAPAPAPPPAPKPEIRIEPEPPTIAPIRPEAIQDGVEIMADQIDMLFKADKSGANSRLTGKTVVIRGIVEKVFVREHLEIRYIMLTGTQKRMTWSLRCAFNKEESSKFSRLSEGQEVAVRGKYDGFSKNIIFKDCALV